MFKLSRALLPLTLVAGLALGGCAGQPSLRPLAATPDGFATEEDLVPSSFVTVVAQLGAGEGLWRGGAVAIDACHAMTNAHVVQYGAARGQMVRLIRPDGAWATASVTGVSMNMDVAVLTFPTGFVPPANVRTKPVRWGERVVATGHPGMIRVVSGRVTDSRATVKPYGRGFYANLPVRPGFSGGPVRDEDGNLAGLTAAGTGGSGFVIDIANALAEANKLLRGDLAPEVSASPCSPPASTVAEEAPAELISGKKPQPRRAG